MAEEKVTITGKSKEEVAYDLFIRGIKQSVIGKGGFKDYEEFLGDYQKALRAVYSPRSKVKDLE